jgi:mannosyltransferase
MQRTIRDVRETEVIALQLKLSHTGVTSTVAALLPVQVKHLKIAALGFNVPAGWPQITWTSFLRHGWRPPAGQPFRICHARRNNEMLAGLILRSVLRMPLRLVFTSAAQRRHTALTRALVSRMDAVIATSPEAASYLTVPAKVILHGVDVSRYRPAADPDKEWVASGLPGRHGIGIFGRVRRQKGTDLFVEAMCRLLPRYPDFTAVVVGAVTTDQRMFAERLKSRASAAGLTARMVFLGERPAAEIPVWLRRMRIVVGPQRWEGFGLVPLEGMASGAAVVATRVGAAHHLVLDGQTGYLVPADDLNALTAKIEVLMKDPALALTMGRAGRAHVEAHFSIEREAAEIQSVYESLGSGRPLPPSPQPVECDRG